MPKKYNSMTFKEFDQTEGSGWRALLPPPGSKNHPTLEQFQMAGEAIKEYIEQHKDLGVPKEKMAASVFSLNWHAFQMYAQSDDNDNNKEMMQRFLQKTINQFETMQSDDLTELQKEYGPTFKPYLEATLIFLGNEKDKQKRLEAKLQETLAIPIDKYPDSNVVFFPGRVFDMVNMANNPDATYSKLFSLPSKLPPLPGQSNWVPASTKIQVNSYKEERESLLRQQKAKKEAMSMHSPKPNSSKSTPRETELYEDQNEAVKERRWKTREIPSPFKDPNDPFN